MNEILKQKEISESSNIDSIKKKWDIVRGLPQMLKLEGAAQEGVYKEKEINEAYEALESKLALAGKDINWWQSQDESLRTINYQKLDSDKDKKLKDLWRNRSMGIVDAQGGITEIGAQVGEAQTIAQVINRIENDLINSFDKFDYNKDGALSSDEIQSISREYDQDKILKTRNILERDTAGTGTQELEDMLNSLVLSSDVNKDGLLQKGEILKDAESGDKVKNAN